MKTIEEIREYNRVKMAKWLKANPEKRERNRIKNIEWRKNNREKCRRATANYRKNYPLRVKNYKLGMKYGISIEEYQQMHKLQEGKCAICKQPETTIHSQTKKVQQLAVDHCHKTGKIRSLLCQDCNRAIGLFCEDIPRMKSAIDYLVLHNGSTVDSSLNL